MQIQAGIITISDRATKGAYADQSGPALKAAAEAYGWKVLAESLVPDEKQEIQRAIRDSENRVRFSGYATAHFKLFVFVLCAIIAAMAGAVYVPQVGIINPSEMALEKSLEVVVWVAVGGRGTLLGPIVGAITVNAMKSWATRAYPDLWFIFLGLLFILVVVFLPGGIVSLPARLRAAWNNRRRPPEESSDLPLGPAKIGAPSADHS